MMKYIREFLKPTLGKIVALIALLASILQLVSLALPNLPEIVKNISWISLGIVVVYIIQFLFSVFGPKIINIIMARTGEEITNQLMVQFVPKLKELQAASLRIQPIEGQAYEYYAKKYGFGYDFVEVDCFINHDGSAIVQRKIQVTAFANLNELDTFLLVPEMYSEGEAREISFGTIRSLTDDWNVTLGEIREEFGRSSASIIIAPSLNSEQSIIYEMIEQLPANLYAINLSSAELENRQTPYDYFSWSISRPTNKFCLRVHFPGFPNQFLPEIYSAEVRYASASGLPSSHIHHKETSNLRGPFLKESDGGRRVCTLDISHPVIGLLYSLRWQPLGKPR